MIKIKVILFLFNISQISIAQNKFSDFANELQLINLPVNTYKLDSISKTSLSKVLNISEINELLIFSPKEPAYCIYNDDIKKRCEHFGKYSSKVFNGNHRVNGVIIRDTIIYSSIKAISRINLSNKYISIILRFENYEMITYDLWNFSEEVRVLSLVCFG